MSEQYLLWMCGDSRKLSITRGRTQREAFTYSSHNWRRGQTIALYNWLPIDAAILYSENHAPGWLNRKPVWLQKEEGG